MAGRGNLSVVGDAIDRAQPAPRMARRRQRGADDNPEPELPMLPAGCPVRPLGKLGQVCFYLDEAGQLIALKPGSEHGKGHIINLFGRRADLVHEYWPRFSDKTDKEGNRIVTGWKPEEAAEKLMQACAHAGLFDPAGKERGRGAHRGAEGQLVLHCGDKIYVSGMPAGLGYQDPGLIEGFVYPTGPAVPRPDPDPCGDEVGVELLGLLRSWHWSRPKIDPYLLLGFIPAAMIGGALDWRSHIWVTGDRGTGKSELERKLLAWLFDGGSLRSHNATEASISQILGKQTLPVFLDEIEPSATNNRAMQVLELARLASSGGTRSRGGADHKATEFVAQSSFYFSSILLPPMKPQDRSRMAICELEEIPAGATPPLLDQARIKLMGRRMRRRLVDQFPRFDATLDAYKAVLGRHGHRGRSQDQFGALLACADLLLFDHVPDAELLEEWGEALRADQFGETATATSDSEEICAFLATSITPARGGDLPEPFSRLIERAIGGRNLIADEVALAARERLENHGLKLGCAVEKGGDQFGFGPVEANQPLYLAVASGHEALARLFREKDWKGGVWSQSFGRVALQDPMTGEPREHGRAIKRVKTRFAGKALWATLVPIAAFVERDGGEA